MKNFLAGLMAGMVLCGGAAFAFPGLGNLRFEHKVEYILADPFLDEVLKKEEKNGWACVSKDGRQLIFIRIK